MNRHITVRLHLIGLATFLTIAGVSAAEPVDGTTGAPLGGIGCGAIKFCAYKGTFYHNNQTPANGTMNPLSARFQFFSKRASTVETRDTLKAPVINGRATDDAIYPCHFVDFGTINGMSIKLTAFSPIDFTTIDRMCYPYAFYEFTVTNTGTGTADASLAFQIVAGMNAVAGKGISNGSLAIFAQSPQVGAILSYGSDNGFFTSGQCSNALAGFGDRVAMKISLPAGMSGNVQFVFSWIRKEWGDTTRYYHTIFSNSATVADSGLRLFSPLRDNAVALVTRMRGSSMPSWLTDMTLNTLCNLTLLSTYMRDGRFCMYEGAFGIFGTMDQMWHARQINSLAVPYLAWQELRYWARTQKSDPEGQIHHDMGGMVAWDDRQHDDYRNIDSWVDLNCGFILSVYETFMATDDHEQLGFLWPYVKKAAQRIRTQAQPGVFGDANYPFTFWGCGSSYDNGGNSDVYNSSLVLPTFAAMSKLADINGEPGIRGFYDSILTIAKSSFAARFLGQDFWTGKWCEPTLAGQWMAGFLRLGNVVDRQHFVYGMQKLIDYYQPLTQGMGTVTSIYDTYNEWQNYLVSHFGGPALQSGFPEVWHALQYDFYERNYLDRNQVFSLFLSVNPKPASPTYLATQGYSTQYISTPVLWRNYYTAVGYQRNKHTGELWLEPRILPEMNHVLTDGFYLSPEGMGTVSCTESGAKFQNQEILFAPDSTIYVSTAYVRDSFDVAGPVYVLVNGIARPFTRLGSEYNREIAITVNDSVRASGMRIVAADTPPASVPAQTRTTEQRPSRILVRGHVVYFGAGSSSGRIEIFDAHGRLLACSTAPRGQSGHLAATSYPRGTCFIRLVDASGVLVEKLAIIR